MLVRNSQFERKNLHKTTWRDPDVKDHNVKNPKEEVQARLISGNKCLYALNKVMRCEIITRIQKR